MSVGCRVLDPRIIVASRSKNTGVTSATARRTLRLSTSDRSMWIACVCLATRLKSPSCTPLIALLRPSVSQPVAARSPPRTSDPGRAALVPSIR